MTTQAEAFRVLRTNLEVALAEFERPTVLVTSANAEEGKTAICAQLAEAFATAGRRVVVVDMDTRHPDVHTWLGGENLRGVTDVLLDRAPLEDCLQYLALRTPSGERRGLYLLSAGTEVANPTELLGGVRSARMLDALSQQADLVLMDSPPVLPVADSMVMGRMAAGALLVVEARRTPINATLAAKDALIRTQTRLLGVIVNKFQPRDAGFSYGYGYGYPADGDSTRGNGSGPAARTADRG
ncbi:MAG: CpsD/CapB family tyrosine-protein kinase [Acidimicrobiales bacterium]